MKIHRYTLVTSLHSVATGLLIPMLSLLFTSRGLSLTQLATGMLFVACIFLFQISYPMLCLACVMMCAGNALGSGSFDTLFIDRYLESNGEESLHTVSTFKTVCETVGYAVGILAGVESFWQPRLETLLSDSGQVVSTFELYILAIQYSVFGFFIIYMLLYMSIGCAGLAETILVNQNTPARVRATILSVQSLRSRVALCWLPPWPRCLSVLASFPDIGGL